MTLTQKDFLHVPACMHYDVMLVKADKMHQTAQTDRTCLQTYTTHCTVLTGAAPRRESCSTKSTGDVI